MKRCVYALAADSEADGGTPAADTEDSSGTRYAAGVAVAGRLKSGPTAQAARPAAASTGIVLRNAFTVNMATHITCVCKEEEPSFG
jgi:hypothetical protein